MLRILFLIVCLLMTINSYADPLLLTPQEIQKLKKYFPSDEDENSRYIWKGDAISIDLPLNKEKRLIFPAKVIPDLKSALTTDQLRLINDNKSLYLMAKKTFSNIRLYVTIENSNQVILIDLSTSDTATNNATYIDLPVENKLQTVKTSIINNNLKNNDEPSVSNNDDYVILIRFAWQQLYAPDNLLDNSLNISRTPMHTAYFISDLVYGDKFYAHPIASWSYQNNTVTAIELRNKYLHKTHIDISRDLCGDWQAASLYPRAYLEDSGNKSKDNTVLFLISQKPFSKAMEMCHGSA